MRAARRKATLLEDTKPLKRASGEAVEAKTQRAASVDTQEDDDDSDSLDELSSDLFDEEDFEIDPNITPQRLNLKVKLPELIPQHPLAASHSWKMACEDISASSYHPMAR